MAKKAKDVTNVDGDTQLAIRLPNELLARVMKHMARMKRATPGVNVSRVDAIRSLLNTALDQAEAAESASARAK